jgi:L-alanine-DL-glutamate epimerase-like enolase superfamily enzyme
VVGEDPHNIDWLYQKMIHGSSGAGSTGGAVVAAISGVELALWDLKGKILQTPIYNLLGGRYRDRIRVYADCGHGDEPTPQSWAARAEEAVSKGFRAIKFDIDRIDPARFGEPFHIGRSARARWSQGMPHRLAWGEVDLIIRLVGAVRDSIGPSVDLALDCHWSYSPRDAITLAKELEPFRLMWLEDPTPPDNVGALKRVTDASPVPICSGENHYTRHGMREMITSRAVDVIQPDIPKAGGLLESKKIADLADIFYIPVAAHNVSSPIATIAACHACASMHNFSVLEFHGQDVSWWDDLFVGDHPLIQDGHIQLPDGPGLGIDLNEDVARAHLASSSSFFE